MPPRRSARISSVRGRGRGRGQSATSREDPPPPPPPAGDQEEIPNARDVAVPVARAHQTDNQPAQNESQTARQSHEEELVVSDDETVEADNATVNRELLRFLRGKPGGPRRAISADFIEAGMEIFKGKSNVDPSDAEHWLKDLQRLFVEMDYPVDRKVRAAVSLLSGEALDWWESVVESVSAGRVTWDFFRKSFEDRYVGEEYYEKCRQAFLDLKQNNMTVNAYEMQFLKLLRYAGGLVTTEKQKCDAFRNGLRFFIRERVALHHDTELSKLVARAKTAETIEALKKNERQHSVDRGRRPYNAPAQSGLVNQFGKRPRDSDRLSHSRVEPVPSAAPVVSGGGSSAPRELPICSFCHKLHTGYNQIVIAPEDQSKTTFNCPYETFAFRRMPFGLCNAPTTFQRCMTAIFSDLNEDCLEIFMDDFSTFGENFDNCLSNLEKVLIRCKETNLVLNWEKCHFMVDEGIVLGHKISSKGMEVNKAKIEVISKLPPPTTVKGIRSFLGHAGFYRRFIEDFSKITKPLCSLLEQGRQFEFNEDCTKAFNLLKQKLVSAPIVEPPDWTLPFELMCDANDYAIGAVLGQRKGKIFHPIYYAGKTLNDAQVNYTTTENEMLAVIFAFDKFLASLP
ncbi:hypothetical protein GQ457_18G012830 [Hibiscus cannabinus]